MWHEPYRARGLHPEVQMLRRRELAPDALLQRIVHGNILGGGDALLVQAEPEIGQDHLALAHVGDFDVAPQDALDGRPGRPPPAPPGR